MTTFDRREEAFENLFAHDEGLHFKAVARRAKLLAAWAGGLMHKAGADAEAYTQSILATAIGDGSDQALFDRVRHDLDSAGAAVSDAVLRAEMERLLSESLVAVRQS